MLPGNGNLQKKSWTRSKNIWTFVLLLLQLSSCSSGMFIPKTMTSNSILYDQIFDRVTNDFVIQFKVPDTAFNLKGNPLKNNLRYKIFAYPSDTPVELLDSIEGYPVLVSLLHTNNFQFHNQPAKGVTVNEPYVVFTTRVPSYRQVVSKALLLSRKHD